jgi:hypothetical protein
MKSSIVDMSHRHMPEKHQREVIEEILSNLPYDDFLVFRNFPVFTPRFNMARFLAQYELFKKIFELPGVIIDCGVYQGASTFTWAKLCEIFCPTDIRKTVHAFDTFEGFTSLASQDGEPDYIQDKVVGGYYGGIGMQHFLERAQEAMNYDRHLNNINRIEFHPGDACQTIPRFVAEKGNGLRIALLNLDFDLYEPTCVALENFYPRMVRGGIIICDEYAIDTLGGGETTAVDEFFIRTTGNKPIVHKFSWHSNPSAYIIVE